MKFRVSWYEHFVVFDKAGGFWSTEAKFCKFVGSLNLTGHDSVGESLLLACLTRFHCKFSLSLVLPLSLFLSDENMYIICITMFSATMRCAHKWDACYYLRQISDRIIIGSAALLVTRPVNKADGITGSSPYRYTCTRVAFDGILTYRYWNLIEFSSFALIQQNQDEKIDAAMNKVAHQWYTYRSARETKIWKVQLKSPVELITM